MPQIQEDHLTRTEGWQPTLAWVPGLCFSAFHTWLISSARADANLFQVRKLRLGVCASLGSLLDEQAPPPVGGRPEDGEKPGSLRDGRHHARTISPEPYCHLLSQELIPP